MRVAYTNEGRVHISQYKEEMKGSIFCPDGHVLIAKRGDIRVHHYAHKSGTSCICSSNKGEWHVAWQDRVKPEMQEVRMVKDGKTHIADICIGNHVVEIQHSPMKKEEMMAREEFYTRKMGHRLTWIFDAQDWEYRKTKEQGSTITMRRLRGCQFPLMASYTGNVTLFLDFGKKELLKVTRISGSTITGTTISMRDFDRDYLHGQVIDDVDVRTFHHHV